VTGRERVHRLHAIGGVVLMVIGVAHVAVAFVEYRSPSLEALWFVGSGFFVLLAGGLNVVLSTALRDGAPGRRGLQLIALLANGAGTLLAGAFVWMTRGQQAQGIALLLLFVACLGVTSFSAPERNS
jgi:hypothetical protein